MSIRASVDIDKHDLILTVDRDSLNELIDLLREPVDGVIAMLPGTKYPMTRPIASLRLRVDSEDLVGVQTGEDAASICGSSAALARLAQEVSRFVEYNDLYEPGMHAHFDPRDPQPARVLRSGSRSLVIAGPVPDEPAEP